MRLIDTKVLLDRLIEASNEINETSSQNQRTVISKFSKFGQICSTAFEKGLLTEHINKYEALSFYWTSNVDSLKISTTEYTRFDAFASSIRSDARQASNAIAKSITELPEHSVSIKLPELTSFEDLKNFCDSMKKVLMQTVTHGNIDGKVSIVNFDSGSLWIDVALGTTLAIKVVGGISWAALSIRNKMIEGDKRAEELRTMKLENSALEAVVTAQNDYVEKLLDSESAALAKEVIGDEADHEYSQRLRLGIKEMAGLIHRGAEIRCRLSEPEDVRNSFPDFDHPLLVESKQKLLAEVAKTATEQVE